ncbi:MAG: DNA polymerase III subunit delta [Treponema sp.]|nr:DNA polymerase III subunit delta [Treponema sp.]
MAFPIYLYTGPEFGERNDAVNSIKSYMRKKFGDIDEYLYYMSETDISEIVTTLQSESLFVPACCVVVRGAELLKDKSDVARISSWLSSVTSKGKVKETSVLILVSDEISVDSKLEKLVPKENRRIFWEMFENRKADWLRNYFNKAGFRITPDAVELILDLVENNTEALRNECSLFFSCFPAEHEIVSADVESVLAHNRAESAFTLFDVLADNEKTVNERLEQALRIFQKIRLSNSTSTVGLLKNLTSCFRRLTVWFALHADGKHPTDLDYKINGFASAKAKSQYRAAAQVWSAGQVAAITALLASTDMEIRSLGRELEENQLQMMLYAIICKGGSFCSVYEKDCF